MYDLIENKKKGTVPTKEEISYTVKGFVNGEIPDHQMSAMLMVIYFQGVNDQEITYLTLEMTYSSDTVDSSPIEGTRVDKYSIGGVGDKTMLVMGPVAAFPGIKAAKMSGCSLGHTGGTADKLESISGFWTTIPRDKFFDIMREQGITVIGQSGNMVPAGKKLYALRDMTATIDSILLIASSIINKKLVARSDGTVLDVKAGNGVSTKSSDDSISLAEKMVSIGIPAGRRCYVLIIDMGIPLGYAVDNFLEITEAIRTLRGNGPEDLTQVCLELAANIFHMADKGGVQECREQAGETIKDGSILQYLVATVKVQGGDENCIWEPERFEEAKMLHEIEVLVSGYIIHTDTEGVGIVSILLGAGHNTKDDYTGCSAGIQLKEKYGQRVEAGNVLAMFHGSDQDQIRAGTDKLLSSCVIGDLVLAKEPFIYARVSDYGVERFS